MPWSSRRPGDVATVTILAILLLAISVRLPSRPDLIGDWAVQAALLIGYLVFVSVTLNEAGESRFPLVRGIAIVGLMFALYATLARVAFEVTPWNADPGLDGLDRLLFMGQSPVLWAAERLTPTSLELFSFVYAFFIPYLYLSIFFGLVARPEREREEFITAFALTYGASFIGYLLLPARGPIVHQAAEFAAPLEGGTFHRMIVESIDAMGGPHGAFPSLHVGASTFLCSFDLRHNTLRGLLYLPLVLLIAVSTIFVRYHYVVDLLAGASIGILATLIASRWLASRENATD